MTCEMSRSTSACFAPAGPCVQKPECCFSPAPDDAVGVVPARPSPPRDRIAHAHA